MPVKPVELTRQQVELALFVLNPAYEYRWISNDEYEWRHVDPVPNNSSIIAAWDTYNTNLQAETLEDQNDQSEKSQLLAQADNAIIQLQDIIDDVSMSNAEAVAAIKLMAQIQTRTIKILKRAIQKGRL